MRMQIQPVPISTNIILPTPLQVRPLLPSGSASQDCADCAGSNLGRPAGRVEAIILRRANSANPFAGRHNPVQCRLVSMAGPRSKALQFQSIAQPHSQVGARAVSKLVVSGAPYRRLPAMSGLGSSAPSAAGHNPSLKRSANGMPAGPRSAVAYPAPRGPAGTPSSPA